VTLELTGIGGGMEEEDATYSAGALREAMEEIGCPIRLVPCEQTLIVRGPGDVRRVKVDGIERPVALVYRYHRTPAHRPWHQDNQGQACLIVFLAELEGEPLPEMELPQLIWLRPEQIVDTAHRDVPLSDLLAQDVELITGPAGPPPMDGLARMTDSQEALVLALGDDAVAFYQELTTTNTANNLT
jgi:8-oxo-dGTP pyrophosphatase MutT (NUDIX family)